MRQVTAASAPRTPCGGLMLNGDKFVGPGGSGGVLQPASTPVSVVPAPQILQGMSQVPQNVTMTMPTITDTATALIPTPQPNLKPTDLLKPLPSITNTAPVSVATPCNSFSSWVNQNPLLGVGILATLAYLVFEKK